MSRSLLDQLTQIRGSGAYDDAVSGIYTAAVAEPATMSGSLQEDLNIIRSLLKELKGTTDWYGDLGNYFDPTNTDAGNTATKDLNLSNLAGETLDSKTILIPVVDDNSGSCYTVSGTSTGFLLSTSAPYAVATDRRGIPIFASVTNSGTYYDEGGADAVCVIDVINCATDSEMEDGSGNIIYAKFHDGVDFAGVGDGTDAYVRFYANNAVTDLSTVTPAPTLVKIIFPRRKVMSALSEHEWLRTDFVNSWEGDVELIEDVSNLWSFTGSSDNDDDASGWTNTTSYYSLQSDPSDLWTAIDTLNTSIGDRDYTQEYYITDGESIADSLDTLDQQIKAVADLVTSGDCEKYIEESVGGITKNTLHSLPYSITYTPASTAGREGMNMDVYVEGQLLAADTGVNGANADRDYGETTASGITFRFNVKPNSNITYIVRA